jgi:hypothetical protein
MNKNNEFKECFCGKKYMSKSGYYYHRKRCKVYKLFLETRQNQDIIDANKLIRQEQEQQITDISSNDINTLASLVKTLIHENKELQNMIIEQNNKMFEMAKEPKTINNNNNNNFNILNYLNTECKDAFDLTEFIKQINITIEELLKIPYHGGGVVDSFKTTFVKQLQDLEYKKRPIHCSDKKRKKFYVKEEGQWDKDEENKQINRAIHNVANRHYSTFQCWKDQNPDWLDDDTKQEHANQITMSLGNIYNDKEKQQIIKELSCISCVPPKSGIAPTLETCTYTDDG